MLNLFDEYYIATRFRREFGKEIDLINPKTFNEKLQYLKLYHRSGVLSVFADKYRVRDYIKKLGFGNYLNDIYGVFDDAEKISWELLPNSFVIKATHGSGWNIICADKKLLDWNNSLRQMEQWLKLNYYYYGREWCYKNIKPRLLIERYLEQNVNDYKFFCFGGRPLFIQVDIDRFINHRRNIYDMNWMILPLKYGYDNFDIGLVTKPKQLEEMSYLAEKLSSNLPFVRVDLFEINGRVFFGEITMYPEAGFGKFCPESIDNDWGNFIDIAPYRPSFIQKQLLRAVLSIRELDV